MLSVMTGVTGENDKAMKDNLVLMSLQFTLCKPGLCYVLLCTASVNLTGDKEHEQLFFSQSKEFGIDSKFLSFVGHSAQTGG